MIRRSQLSFRLYLNTTKITDFTFRETNFFFNPTIFLFPIDTGFSVLSIEFYCKTQGRKDASYDIKEAFLCTEKEIKFQVASEREKKLKG